MGYTVEYPDIPPAAARLVNHPGTAELATEVVEQQVAICIWDSGKLEPDRPRTSLFRMGYTVGDRQNPSLTPAEAKYMLRLIEHAARTWRTAHEIIE